jgi:hypothetical protein
MIERDAAVFMLLAGCTTPAAQGGAAPSAAASVVASAAATDVPVKKAIGAQEMLAIPPRAEDAAREAAAKAGTPPAGQRIEAKITKFDLDPTCKEPRVTCEVTVSLVKIAKGTMVSTVVAHASRESTPNDIEADKVKCAAAAAESGANDLLAARKGERP